MWHVSESRARKKNWAEGRLIELVSPSKIREAGKCSYCNYCGGCKWQQIRYDRQLAFKKQHVVESLEHLGRLKDTLVHDVIASKIFMAIAIKWSFPVLTGDGCCLKNVDDPDVKKGFGIGLHGAGNI